MRCRNPFMLDYHPRGMDAEEINELFWQKKGN